MQIVKDSCIRISKKYENKQWVRDIIKHLTRKSTSYGDKEVIEVKQYYDENDIEYLIPRFYPIEKYGHTSKLIIDEGEDIDVKSNITPRNIIQKNSIDWFLNHKEGILCLKPGEGKTVISIDAICKIGKKTIIFVHKNDLGIQWIERIVEHTELRKENIGWLRSSSYKTDLLKPIIVSTVQTFCSLTKKTEFVDHIKNCGIGIAIWDESHTSVSAEMFSKTSLYTPSARVYGLSATPERLDGNTDIMNLHLSDVYIPEGSTDTLEPRTIMIAFDHCIAKKYKFVIKQLYRKDDDKNKGIFNKGVYLSKLIKSKDYLTKMKQIIKKINDSNRNALILSDRINILEDIMSLLPSSKCGLFVGKNKHKRDDILKKKIIFSTYLMSRDGLDIPRLDCIVFCTPVSNIEQAVGRIVRVYDNKKVPVVIDIVDSGSDDMINRAKYRRKFYEQKGWELEEKRI